MAFTSNVYGQVRGGAGSAGAALAYNGSFWVPASQLPTGTPGTALSAWTEGQVIQISVPAVSSVGAYPHIAGRDYCNVVTFPGVDPTGILDSRAGFQAAINYACSNKLVLYVPYGQYNIYGILTFPSGLSVEGPATISGQSIQPQFLQSVYQTPGGQGQYFWGGSWMGPTFRVAPSSTNLPLGFVLSSNIYRLQFGGLAGTNNNPTIYLGVTPTSSLNGLPQFTMEWTVNYRENVTQTNPIPYCGGCPTDHSVYTQAFSFHCNNTGATFGATASITTANGTFSCTTGGSALSTNTDYSVAVTYDGVNLKLFMGPPGSAPSITVTTPATGNVVQNFWEDFIIGGGNTAGGCNYPMQTGVRTNKLEWGNFRLSNTARTITTMRGTEFTSADVDSNTNLLITFAPAYRGSVIGDPASVIGTCFSPSAFGYTVNGPGNIFIPIRDVCNGQFSFGPTVSFHRLEFNGYEAIDVDVAIGVSTYDCNFVVRRGISRYNNSYEGRDVNPTFNTLGFNPGNAAYGWGANYVANSGGVLTTPNWGGPQGSNFGLIFNGSGGSIRDFFINGVGGYNGLFVNNATSMLLENCELADEGSPGTRYALAMFNRNATITWIGGGAFAETTPTAGCNIIVDAGEPFEDVSQQTYLFNLDLASVNVASCFKCPPGGAPTIPIMLDTAIQGQGTQAPFPWSDGSAPIMVRPLEQAGVTVWNATGAGTITCMWGGNGLNTVTGPDFSCRTIIVTDTNLQLTGTTPLLAPCAFAGYRRRVLNMTPKPLVFRAATGGTVTIGAFATAEVESDGTNWTRVTSDQTGDFSPAYISGNVFWAHADTLTASPVSSWSYGAANLAQASGPSQPTWTFNSANVGAQSSVLYSGSQNVAAANAAPLQLTSAMSVFAVVYLTSAVLNTVVSKGATGEFDAYVTGAGTIDFVRGGTAVASTAGVVAQNTPTLITITHAAGGAVSFFVNGVAQGTASITLPVSTTTNGVQLGQRSDLGTNLHGEEPEVLLINRAVSAAEQTAIQRYLGAKYGITVP